MHMVDDMCNYGKPKEANAEVGERTTNCLPNALVIVVESNTNHFATKCLFGYQIHFD
jgi:hypothetical protein